MSTFDQLVAFGKEHPIQAALYASLFTWGLTAAGAALVFFFKKMNRAVLDGMLGFTGGVMVAASFWSLLSPAIDNSPGEGFIKVIPSAIGFALGALALFGMDKLLPHLHINFKEAEAEGVKTNWHKTTLLVLAITLHNIPEGLAVGVVWCCINNDRCRTNRVDNCGYFFGNWYWDTELSGRICGCHAFKKARCE